VAVALVNKLAMCMRRIIQSSVPCLVLPYFITWFINWKIFWINVPNVKWVFWFSKQRLFETYSRTPLLLTLVIRIGSARLGSSGKFVENSTKLPCLEITGYPIKCSTVFVYWECRVLSGKGLCDELITRPEESYRLCCVVVCGLETSRMGAPYICH
jgi:hypothetical protein